MIRLISWNIARRRAPWSELHGLGADIALLQEAGKPGPDWAARAGVGPTDRWETAGVGGPLYWRTAVVGLNDRLELHRRVPKTIPTSTTASDWVISRAGSITAADIVTDGAVVCTVVSAYAAWEVGAGRPYADASAHKILSDLSPLLPTRHRLIVAGDWNLLRGYGEYGNKYWETRYDTVFKRAEALGLQFVEPQYPMGCQADPWPDELPRDSLCVPTFHHSRQQPRTATRQLDFVFASTAIADRLEVRALNKPDEWGPSDHCRVLIDADL